MTRVVIFHDLNFVTCAQSEEELKLLGLEDQYKFIEIPDTLFIEYEAAKEAFVRIMKSLDEYNAKSKQESTS